jgi:hypothetical protein
MTQKDDIIIFFNAIKNLYKDMLQDVPYGKSAEYVLRWNDITNDMNVFAAERGGEK